MGRNGHGNGQRNVQRNVQGHGGDGGDDQPVGANEVRLLGRVSNQPELRELPSGDPLWTFRLVVSRPPPPAGPRPARRTVDTLDCAVWERRLRRAVAGWRAGDVVEVSGSVRRRFYRTGAGTASRTEIEVTRGRLIRRGASA